MARSQYVFVPNVRRGAALARAMRPREFRLKADPTKKCRHRRLPRMTQREAFTAGSDPFTPGRRAANCLGRSREPPVLTRFGPISVERKFARAVRCVPKRLPSRRWEQNTSCERATPSESFEDDDDYDRA